MHKEKEVPQYESGFPAMRYKQSDAPCGYEYKIVKSAAEEKELGPKWYMNRDFEVEINTGSEKSSQEKGPEEKRPIRKPVTKSEKVLLGGSSS